MSVSSTAVTTGYPPSADRRRPAAALILVLCAQLMVILDMTVVNVALPSIEHGLHFSATSLSWVLNAYALTFGGLLLLGGRAGDILGRRRVFLTGIALFTLASLAAGLATGPGWLIAARAVQGVGGAIASPAALALVVSAFPEGGSRNRAMALYAAIASGGASLGLVLGGVITQWASWRWAFFINLPVGIAVAACTPVFLTETPRQPGHFDLAGAATSVTGMVALVYAFIRAASAGWSDPVALAAFMLAVAGLAAFILIETRAAQPVTPLRLFADGQRAASYLARLLLVGGMFGMFFFATQFLQVVLHFSPVRAGAAFLPTTVLIFGVSRLAARLLGRFPPVPLAMAGIVPVIAGMAWLSRISAATTYVPGVLGPMILFGIGMGLAFVPLTTAALAGVAAADSGAASSMVNVTQQVGGALGLAVLVTVFGQASRAAGGHQPLVHGMASAFGVATCFDVCALLVMAGAALLARRGR
ncbi:MAG TPA: MFS transporter [Streptosporangiaceae bacterium]|nr:MFS transporter [Streptosporangiaceae bacterium]